MIELSHISHTDLGISLPRLGYICWPFLSSRLPSTVPHIMKMRFCITMDIFQSFESYNLKTAGKSMRRKSSVIQI